MAVSERSSVCTSRVTVAGAARRKMEGRQRAALAVSYSGMRTACKTNASPITSATMVAATGTAASHGAGSLSSMASSISVNSSLLTCSISSLNAGILLHSMP